MVLHLDQFPYIEIQIDLFSSGDFSLAAYPYSLKLIWSPFVDSIYLKNGVEEDHGLYRFKPFPE